MTEITLTGGARVRVIADTREVEAAILSAARGSLLEFAWMTEAETGHAVAINPDQVLLLRDLGDGSAAT